MRWVLAVGVALCLIGAGSARAGAWMREDGRVFLSVKTTLRHVDGLLRQENDVYLDYGLGPKLGVGASLLQTSPESGHALVFLRLPLGNTDGPSRMAAELGLGAHMTAGQWAPMYKLVLAWGRGLNLRRANGWIQVEGAVEHRAGTGPPLYKLDLVLGQSDGGRLRPMVGLGLTGGSGRPVEWSASAALLIEGGKKTTWLIGTEVKQSRFGLTLGMWRDF